MRERATTAVWTTSVGVPSVGPSYHTEEDSLGLDVMRGSVAAAPSASEHEDEEPVVCTAPAEADDDTVVCTAPAEDGEEKDAPEDVADVAAPAGLAERWRREAGDETTVSFEQVWDELKAFLVSASASKAPTRPTARVDVLWHEFILFTRDYHAFCGRLGGYVHHAPEVAAQPSQ
ncbi:MAG: hypothetical protein JWO17_1653 [Actinomycetia bacterium]|nr:hypothetical protein [Actinomycetes bacterium]